MSFFPLPLQPSRLLVVGSSPLMFTCHLTPFGQESETPFFRINALSARTQQQRRRRKDTAAPAIVFFFLSVYGLLRQS